MDAQLWISIATMVISAIVAWALTYWQIKTMRQLHQQNQYGRQEPRAPTWLKILILVGGVDSLAGLSLCGYIVYTSYSDAEALVTRIDVLAIAMGASGFAFFLILPILFTIVYVLNTK